MTTSHLRVLGLYRPVGALLLVLAILFMLARPADAPAATGAGASAVAPTAAPSTPRPAPTVAVPTIAVLAPVAAATVVATLPAEPEPSPTRPEPSSIAVPATQVPAATAVLGGPGREYVVVRADWLKTLAEKFYGDPDLYTLIMNGTNAMAEVDPSFARIRDEDLIVPGQKLWIPDKPAGR